MSLLAAYLESLPLGFVPADLLAGIDTRRDASGARLFVTAVAVMDPKCGHLWARDQNSHAAMTRGPVTVLSVLLELREMGALESVEQIQGGFRVVERMRKERAA